MKNHVTNRTAGKFIMLRRDEDFSAFEQVLLEAHEREPLRILGYCLMGNHWHFVVWPSKEGQMSRFFRWLTLTHAVRWRPRPPDWVKRVNAPINEQELARLELSEQRERPYGDADWVTRTVKRLGLEHTVRREGRPAKQKGVGR